MKIIFPSLLVFLALHISAQSPPEAYNYSGVARNSQNGPLVKHTIGIQFGILQGSVNGTMVYNENHITTTDEFGVFDLAVGTGAVQNGVFANIDWSNNKYFLCVSLDTAGGTNFILMGTTQLLSVPYALYAKSAGSVQNQTLSIRNDTIFLSPNGGFVKLPASTSGSGVSTILLTGDITDAEAAAQIQQEFGPSTQYIDILNTTQLTTASFNSLTKSLEIRVENNAVLKSINFNALTTSLGKINIYNNSLLQSISFPSLTKTYEEVTISANTSVQSISFPLLETAVKLFSLNDGVVSSINLSSLKSVSGRLELRFHSNSTLTTLNLPSLQFTAGFTLTAPLLTSFGVPSLNYINGNIFIDSTALSSLSFPILDSMNILNTMWISNSPITALNLPSIKKITYFNSGDIIIDHTLLTSIDFLPFIVDPNFIPLSNLGLSIRLDRLTSESVNNILAWAVLSLSNGSSNSLDLSGQTPPAPPTGQGIIDKQTLQNNGIGVYTD